MNTVITGLGTGEEGGGSTALLLSPVLQLTEVINPSWVPHQNQALGLQ